MLLLSYTIQKIILNVSINFQNPRFSIYCEMFDTNSPMYYSGVRDRKNEKWKKEGKNKSQCLSFIFNTQYHQSQGMHTI